MPDRLSKDALIERLKSIKLLTLDVDGVMTDGGVFYAADGSQLRQFNIKDGMGINMAQKAGVEIAFITASTTPDIAHRGKVLKIKHMFMGADDKLAILTGLCAELSITLDEVAHIGDDVNDLVVLNAIGLPITVADAVDDVLDVAVYVTTRGGGKGAVREIIDLILKGRR